MPKHLDRALSDEIRATVGHLPPWKGDPTGRAIDYTNAPIAYVASTTLIHGDMQWHPAGLYLPTRKTKALLVQRASGDGVKGSWSSVSGYIDVLHDPELTDEAFDPVLYAGRAEPHEECGISWKTMSAIELHLGSILSYGVNLTLGQRFEEPRFGGHGLSHIVTMLGVCHGSKPPAIHPNPKELGAYAWVPLEEIANRPNLSPGYLENTLPSALGSLGLRPEAIQELLRLDAASLK